VEIDYEELVNNDQYSFECFSSIRRYSTFDFLNIDPSWMIYITDISGQYNLWRQRAYVDSHEEGNRPHQLTNFVDESVSVAFPSPVDSGVIFFADYKGNEMFQIFHIDAFDGHLEKITDDSTVSRDWGQECFSPDGKYITYSSNEHHPSDMHVYVKDIIESGVPKRITKEAGWYAVGYWSPDNKRMTCSQIITDIESKIWLLEVENAVDNIVIAQSRNKDEISQSIPGPWSSDGRGFYFITNIDDEYRYLAFFDIARSKIERIISMNWDIEHVAISKNGDFLIWSANEDGYSRLFKKNLRTNEIIQMDTYKKGIIRNIRLSSNEKKIGLLIETATSPANIFTMDLETANLERLTHSFFGNISEDKMVEPMIIRYKSFDELEIPALLYQPKKINKKVGVLIMIHGGPNDQERPDYAYEGLYQYLVSRNIAILAPNYRGSTGYGKDFEKKILHDWGGGELRDLEYSVKWLQKQSWVDMEKLGVCGSSFGGFEVLSCLSRLPSYWRAGVDIFGPSNLVSTTKTAVPYWKHSDKELIGDPEIEEDFLKRRSPITYIDNIRADLLIIHGANDPIVAKNESDQIVARLRAIGKNVTYVVLDDEGHGFTKRTNLIKVNKLTAEFLLNILS
jgi:dipeptidyl aminopeptidase/acylaminoacyl peptidase